MDTLPAPLTRKEAAPQRGTMGRNTRDFRTTIGALLVAQGPNIGKWVNEVAKGRRNTAAATKATGEVWAVRPNPQAALSMVLAAAEFAAPKLARIEHTGAGGGPVAVEVVTLHLGHHPGHASIPSPVIAPDVVEVEVGHG